MSLAIDLLLALGLLWLGWQVVAGRTPFRSIVMFAAFGVLMAVVWARLGSPDLALAEAAIGAGLTGAMLLLTWRRMLEMAPERAGQRLLRPSRLAAPVGVLCAMLVLGLGWTLAQLPEPQSSAGGDALAALDGTGVGNPVTAVLLLFRGYDTLLEMVVLLAAWVGVCIVQPIVRPARPQPPERVALLDALLAMVVPSAVLVGGYLLHAGGQAPGGAFQAGAVLAATGVLLALCGRLAPLHEPLPLQRLMLVLGVAVFSVTGLASEPAFALTGMWAVYTIEAALTVSIAITLVLLFLSSGGVRRRR
ncbi:hydrogenase subunit MbhD domain-containing protein [Rehaibacterium terrae]|uniref:Multisubunit Na+/H+ antiporter MnhB subunit n=1 Tax=Rehaibacterium terrae TaxID=1341696 RepID=A0A7W7V6Y2_9GAMM|nr:multisubunit Na+/H+ antiporter MnhB subunit [Rehaibacterium terrae]